MHAAEGLEADAAVERVRYFQATGLLIGPVLDVGCGNGYSVLELRRRGVPAVGVDRSLYRLSRWVTEGVRGRRLVVADATALPFRHGVFASVIASGMLEHIGVLEQPAPYRVIPLPTKRQQRKAALGEMRRVSSGVVLVDFPNGWFPVDFWHGESLGAFRLHPLPDPLNPSVREVRSYADGARVTVLPLRNRLRFRQVGTKRWGRALSPLMRLFIRVLDWLPRWIPLLALCYPFLVLRIDGEAAST